MTKTTLPIWHAGEMSLQQAVGSAGHLARHGHRIVQSHLPEQHRRFYPQLPFIVAGSVDATGDTWATVLAGRPGFLQSPDPLHLSVAYARNSDDPADAGMNDGDAVAVLGIELHTRRRNRVNGKLRRTGPAAFEVEVEQAFGNCPQYIQLREFEYLRDPATATAVPARTLSHLDERAREIIANADTFFVASYVEYPDGHRQVDVSHRGGKPGFVRVAADGTLTVPDFAGNQFFNTLGNLLANPRAGLVFVDFENGDLLQISGDAQVILESPEIAQFRGAERLWRVTPRKIVHRADALPLRWNFEPQGWSPEALGTGSWQAA